MRTVFFYFVLPALAAAMGMGIFVPRLDNDPPYPQTAEALATKAEAERLYDDMTRATDIKTWVRKYLLVQRVTHSNYQELPGSCSGFSDQPKPDRAYDRYVDMTEIGLFGTELQRWHAICGGRLPLRRDVIVAPTKAEWEDARRAESLAACKRNHFNCGFLGDFSKTQ